MSRLKCLKTIKGKGKHLSKGKPVDLIYVCSVSKDDECKEKVSLW